MVRALDDFSSLDDSPVGPLTFSVPQPSTTTKPLARKGNHRTIPPLSSHLTGQFQGTAYAKTQSPRRDAPPFIFLFPIEAPLLTPRMSFTTALSGSADETQVERERERESEKKWIRTLSKKDGGTKGADGLNSRRLVDSDKGLSPACAHGSILSAVAGKL